MIHIDTLEVGQLKTNCYLLVDQDSKDTIIVDAGDDAEFITQRIIDNLLRPRAIIATHGHFDHVLAVGTLQKTLGIDFYLHTADEFLLHRMQETAEYFLGNYEPNLPPYNTQKLKTGMFTIGTISVEIIPTPGHTPGSVSIVLNENSVILVGDLIFAHGGVGRTDFAYSDKVQLFESIKLILQMRPNLQIFPGHGDRTSIRKERLGQQKIF